MAAPTAPARSPRSSPSTDDELGERSSASASLSPYKERAAYRTSVEDSVYVAARPRRAGHRHAAAHRAARGRRGQRVPRRVRPHRGHAARPLAALHARCGFELVGIEREVGRKFNRWLDVALMQRLALVGPLRSSGAWTRRSGLVAASREPAASARARCQRARSADRLALSHLRREAEGFGFVGEREPGSSAAVASLGAPRSRRPRRSARGRSGARELGEQRVAALGGARRAPRSASPSQAAQRARAAPAASRLRRGDAPSARPRDGALPVAAAGLAARSASQPATPPRTSRTPPSPSSASTSVDGAVEEGPVVADDDDDARPVVEEVLERAQRVEVEVVGRLVEQQHVRLLDQRQQQLQAAALAARQRADRRQLGVAVEPEPLASARTSCQRRLALVAGDRRRGPAGPGRGRGRAGRSSRLARSCPARRAPVVGREAAGDEVEQRRLAGTVRADDRRADRPARASRSTADRAPWCRRARRSRRRAARSPFDPSRVRADRTGRGRRRGPAASAATLDERGRRGDARLRLASCAPARRGAARPARAGPGCGAPARRPRPAPRARPGRRGTPRSRSRRAARRHVQVAAATVELEHRVVTRSST